jgi:TP901 family phage tail tape measure protein
MYEDTGVRLVVLGISESQRQLATFDNALNKINTSIHTLESSSASFTTKLTSVGNAFVATGRQLTASLTLPIVGAATGLAAFAINFEDSFAGVSKTVDGVAKGFDELALSMYGTSEGLTDAQEAAVFANKDFGKLTEKGLGLRDTFLEMSTDIPIAASELAKIAQISGQLGVKLGTETNPILEDFTRTIALLAETTAFSSEEAAFNIARMGNIMGVTSEEMGTFAQQFGNSIVELGNNAAATEPEIAALSLRIAGAARAVGMTTPEVLGLSAALAASGIKAEMGGSAVSRILTQMSYAANDFQMSTEDFNTSMASVEDSITSMQQAISQGATFDELKAKFSDLNLEGFEQDLNGVTEGTMSMGAAMDGVRTRTIADLNKQMAKSQEVIRTTAQVMGMTETALISLIRTDPTAAFTGMLGALSKLQEEGKLSAGVLDVLDLNTIRLKDTMNRLGPNVELVNKYVNISNEEWIKQTALQEEAQKKFATTKNQLKLLYNEIKAFGAEIYFSLEEPLNVGITALRNFVAELRDLPKGAKLAIAGFAALAASIGPLLIIFGSLLKLTAFSIDAFAGLGRIKLFNPFAGLLSAATGTVGKIKGVFTGLIGLITGLKAPITGIFSFLTNTVSSMFTGVTRIVKTLVFVVTFALSFINAGFMKALGFISGVLGQITNIAGQAFGAIGKLAGTIFDGMSWAFSGLVKKVLPALFGKIIALFTGFVTTVPLLLAAGLTAGLAVAIGPDLIKAASKNWKKLTSTLKDSASQFVKDLKSEGIEQAILLLFSGGSTGSGRESSLYGIAKALGATEETARKFGYTMGEIAATVIKIVKSFGELIRGVGDSDTAVKGVESSASRTADIILGLTAGIRDFLMGFYTGFTSTFETIRAAWSGLSESFGEFKTAVGEFFSVLFGETEKGIQQGNTFSDALNTGAGRAGKSFGEILGELLTFGIQLMTVFTEVATAVVKGFTDLANAYKENGIKGIFDELLVVIGDVWNALKVNLVTLVEPAFNDLVNWIKTDGVSLLGDAIKVVGDLIGQLWSGWDSKLGDVTNTKMMGIYTAGGKKLGNITADAFKAAFQSDTGRMTLDTGETVSTSMFNSGELGLPQEFTTTDWSTTSGFEGLQSILSNLMTEISDFISSDETKEAITNALTGIGNFIENDVWPVLQPYADKMWNAVVDWLEKKVGEIDFFQMLKDAVMEDNGGTTTLTAEDINKRLNDPDMQLQVKEDTFKFGRESGIYLVNGVMRGIDDKTAENLLKVNTMAVGMIGLFKTTMGIGSPSTVFQGFGQDIMMGLQNGMLNMSGSLFGVMGGIGSNVSTIMNNIKNGVVMNVNTMQSSLTNFMTAVPSIMNNITSTINNAVNSVISSLTRMNNASSSLSGIGGSVVSSIINTANTVNRTFAPTVYGTSNNVAQDTDYLYQSWLRNS